MSYGIGAFGAMLRDDIRRDAYERALREVVTPGARVLDLGAGTGYYSLVALDAGAGHVTAIDRNDAITDLPAVLGRAGYGDRATVFLGDVADLDEPPFDVIVSDIRGQTSLYEDALEVVVSTARRLLAPGGRLIPLSESLHAALVADAPWFEEATRPWSLGGHDFAEARRRALAEPRTRTLRADALASTSATWADLDLAGDAAPHTVSGTVTVEASATTATHGVAVWFSTALSPSVSFSTEPSDRSPTYSHLFLPFPEPVAIDAGDTCEVRLAASRIRGRWLWDWSVRTPTGRCQSSSLAADPRLLTAPDEPDMARLRIDALLLRHLADGASAPDAAQRAADELEVPAAELVARAERLRARASTPPLRRLR